MKSTTCLSLLLSLGSAALGQLIQYPPLTGTYDVGTTSLELIDPSRIDTFSPGGGPRDLMVSAFYPTHLAGTGLGNCTRRAIFPPQTARTLEKESGLPNGTLSLVFPNACSNASPAAARSGNATSFPLLLFSPGFGATRLLYTGIAELISSYGYVVVTIDHPYTSNIVEYPDGRTAVKPNITLETSERLNYLATRRRDVAFVYSQLRNGTTLSTAASRRPATRRWLSAIRRKIDLTNVGLFGHSFGGSTTATTMLNDTTIKCGANLDGPIYGPAVQAGLDQPFLMMAAADTNRTTYPGWTEFYSNLRGFKRDITIANTKHIAYTDGPVIAQLLQGAANATAANGTAVLGSFNPTEIFGTLPGFRVRELLNAYLTDFFGGCLKGETPELVVGSAQPYPEVTLEA